MMAAFFGNSPPSSAKYNHSSAQPLSQLAEAVGLIQSNPEYDCVPTCHAGGAFEKKPGTWAITVSAASPKPLDIRYFFA
jgi:hypothetical protein